MKSRQARSHQLAFSMQVSPAVYSQLANGTIEQRGAVYTRREVVDFILDLVGYTVDKPLQQYRLLEPSFGDASFLLPVVERLLSAYQANVVDRSTIIEDLTPAIRAVEVHRESIERTRIKLHRLMIACGVCDADACRLLESWIIEADFLLAELPHDFTHVVGNPPYVRQDNVPAVLMAEYRARYSTIYDRADLYVPFIERCLRSLERGGALGFICADRWMKNRYGAPLRAMVARDYHLVYYVDMVNTPAFHSDVSAYPAITVIRRETPGPTRILHRPRIHRDALAEFSHAMRAESVAEGSGIIEVSGVARSYEPWILQSFDQLAVVRRLEAEFPVLEDAGCKVGIGVATGADSVFIGSFSDLDVEPDRKLPLVTTKDLQSGAVNWGGLGVINPFNDDGSLVRLETYPKLAAYLERHVDVIRNRNCAKTNPRGWYRTIDRIYPALLRRPKLLIPDIKGEAHIVYEDGHLYPHHNLYYLTSQEWDLKALQAVLQSGIAKLFISLYSTQMRGGYLRFQAQYLRRIRLPRWHDISEEVREALINASYADDIRERNRAVFDLYRLTPDERLAIEEISC